MKVRMDMVSRMNMVSRMMDMMNKKRFRVVMEEVVEK